ncbi:MAG: flagellar hook-length control protein FliK [Proteobacteria bacterium]|nr:flagellar hook-length control protein FliK [Pseudomonadota bacterium]
MAASLLTSQNPMPMTAAPAPEGTRVNQPSVVPAAKAGSGRSFSDELMKPSAAPSGSQATSAAAAGTAARPTPTRGTQDAQVNDSSTTAGQAPKRTSAAVKHDVDKSPAVAMLTGKLDRVPATDIPALVTGNKFINDALSTDEIPEYLNKPAAVADLVNDLGLPPQMLQQVQAVGLDPGQKLTPNAFLKAMGIDPQRVMAELTQLKANLPLEGLAPYINRAQALNPTTADLVAPVALQPQPVQPIQADRLGQLGQQQMPGPTPVTPTIPLVADVDPIGFAWVAKPNTLSPTPLEPKPYPGLNGLNGLNPGLQIPAEALPERPSQSDELSPQALMAAMQGLPRTQRPISDLLKATPLAPADERVVVAASMLRAPNGVDDSLEAVIARANPDGSLDVLTLQDAPLARPRNDFDQPATLNKASFDAFAQLGAKMRAADTVVLADPEPTQRAVSFDPFLNEQILSRGLDVSGKPEAAFALLKGRANDPGVVMMQVKTTEVATVMPASASSQGARFEALDQKALLRDLMQNNSDVFGLTKVETIRFDAPQSSAQPMQDLRLQSPMLMMTSEEKSGDRNSSGGEQPSRDPGQQSDHGKGLRELGLSLHQPQTQQTHTTSFATSAAATTEPLNVQNRFDLMQKVVNHATMLVKQGGGTVRLDLSSPEFGPLELALNMNKDKIDLRVLAGSDRARDAIAADLNQLKGALAIQNVQLGKVEVGVSGRQPQSQQQFTGMNQQGGGQQMGGRSQDEWRGQVRTPQVNPVSTIARPRVPAAMLQGQVNDQGRIAVRA